jgi:hypothetical protein
MRPLRFAYRIAESAFYERPLSPAHWATAAGAMMLVIALTIHLALPAPAIPTTSKTAPFTVLTDVPLVARDLDCLTSGIRVCTATVVRKTTPHSLAAFLRLPLSELMRLNPQLERSILAYSTISIPVANTPLEPAPVHKRIQPHVRRRAH